MVRGLVILGLLGGVGWYAYRKVLGSGSGAVTAEGALLSGDGADATGGVGAWRRQSVSQAAVAARTAATTAASKARSIAPGSRGGATDQMDAERDREADALPREARAAAMASMPAVQPPATIPEPDYRAP